MGRLGYSSITLTDLTETLSTSLVLESNHYSQTKIGNTYSPNFTESGNGVVITPSLFIGQSKIEIVQNGPLVKPATGMNDGYICYKIGEVEYSNATHPSGAIYVDNSANLHINKNLTDSVTVVAYITNYRDTAHSYTVEKIQATNPVNILFLENNNTGYQATITATRPYFQDTNAADISLTAKLYNGTQEITSGVSYNWSAVTNSSYSSTSKTITVARASISNREYYTCKITHNGITYTANQMLYDFTDMYSCEIGYDKALIFTDKAKTIELTARVYLNGEEIISGVDGYNLSYEWTALVEGSTSPIALTGTAQTYSLQNSDTRLKGKNYLVFCEVSQTNSGTTRRIASSSVSVSYSPVYRAVITPNTIFVPTKSNGDYSGVTSGKYSFTFKLVGEDGNPLAKTGTAAPTGTSITFAQASAGKWDYTGEITLPTNSWSTIGDFKIYDFSYTYLGQSFTESVYVVKQKAGADGSNGTPGDSAYTVFLSNENFSFASSGEKAVANQTKETKVYAYQGTTQRPVKVMKVKGVNASTLTGGVKADIKDNDNVVILQFSVSNNNTIDTKITFYSTNNLHGADEFDIELEVDGITFYRRISYTVPASVVLSTHSIQYAVSNSGTDVPTTGWSDALPTVDKGEYLWTRTTIKYNDETPSVSYTVVYNGTDGLGIRSAKEQYYLSTSNTDMVGGDWVDVAPPWQLGTYMWTRSVITYDDDSTYTTEGLCVSSWDSVVGIEIGARNLHFGTENWDDVAFVTKSTATISGEELKLPKNSAPNGMLVPITPGELYTVSVDIKTDDQSATEQDHVGIWFWTDETNYLPYNHCVYIRGNYSKEWKRYSVTFTAPDGVKYLQVSPRNVGSNNYVYFKKLMVEHGNKATDWSPAPEDIQQTTDVEYRLSNSSTSLTGSYTWSTTAPQWVNGKYMWSRTKIIYRNGTVKYAPSENGTCISGATGATGNGISNMIHKYAISATMERPADSEFTLDSPPEVLPAGCKSVWHKQTIQFTNGTSQTFYTLETTRGEDASAYSLIDITPSAINYGITNGIGFFEESAITAKGVRYSADSATAIPLTSEDGKVWLYGSIDNAKWVNIVNGRSLDAQGKFEYRLSEAWGWNNNNLILGHKTLNGQGDCECVRPNLNSTFNQGLSTSIQIDENNTIAYNSTPLESSAKEHGYVRIHLDKIIKRYHLTAGDKLIYSIYTWSTMPDTNNNNVINFWIDKTDDNLIVDIKMEAENYQSDSSTSWKRVFYTFTLTEQMVSEARYLYFYYKNLQPAGNGTTHYRRWTAPKLEIATPEKTQPTAWGYNRKASWRPDIFGYRFFRMELWDASGERKYDEQTIPVIQENSLYSSQNLLRGTDVKIYPLLEEESAVGLTTGRFGLINNLEPIDLMGQVITISYLRYFSPNGVITQIDTNGDKRFGCSLNSEFTFQRGTSRATLKWGWLYNDQSFSGAFENGARRVSETEYIYKPIYYSPDNDETIYTEEDLVEIAVDGGYYLNYKTNTPNDLPYISRPKLEFGARQSAWLPSQEDISFSSIKGMNLLENSYRKQVDSLGFSFRIDTDDDYTLSWESISSNGQAKIFNNGVELSAYATPLEKNGGAVNFRNLKQDYVLLILPGTTGTSITFSKLKLERGTERTPWILADGDVQEVIKEAEDYVNKDNIINILNAGGAIIPVLPEDYENIKRVMETVINNDPEQKALSSFLQVYQPATAKGEDKFYFREIISAIDLGYDQNGTPYLQLSTQFSAEEGNSSNYYMKLTNEKLGFYENEKELAYFSSSQMFINGAAISENIIFGHKTIGGIIFTHGDTGIGISRIKKNDSRLPIKATEAGEV